MSTTSSTSRTRATNLTGLIDIDALVEANTLRQKTKINTYTQNLKIQQYKQEQYRSVISKAKDFYSKYCDVLKGGNFLSSSTYSTVKYTSSNSAAVEATSTSRSEVTSYKVSVTQLASKASVSYDNSKIVSGNKVKIQVGSGEVKEFTFKGATNSEIAKNLNADLANAGIAANAKYSDFALNGSGGLVIESSKEGNTPLSVIMTEKISNLTPSAVEVTTDGSFATSIAKGNLKAGNAIEIDGHRVTMAGSTPEEITENLNNMLASYGARSLSATYDSETGKMTIKNNAVGDDEANKFSAKLVVGDKTSNLTVNLDKGYQSEINITDLDASKGININGQNFRLSYNNDGSINKDALNEQIVQKGFTAEIENDKLVIKSKAIGTSAKFTLGISSYSSSSDTGNEHKDGKNLIATIKDASGNTYTIDNNRNYTSNSITLDGTTFKFNEVTSSEVTLTGKRDGSELKDKIVDFIEDYNELLGYINGKLFETYDKSYKPLTDDDKEGLSDSEIEKLEEKAQIGLLRNDSYLRSFADDMKLTMTTMLENSGISLERIGVKPVQDYKSKNGLFTIDEDKLLEAIENNPEQIEELFAGSNGIITQLKDNLYKHATGTFSVLANKAGVADGVTANTNEMTKDIEQRKKQIETMKAALKAREDALYTRYASLESSLSSLQAQQSSLSSYFVQ